MRFVLANECLRLNGRNFAGFPLLLGDDGEPMEPAQTYLWDLLSRAGRIGSKRTWGKYGRDIYDYFAFIYANGIDWRVFPETGLPGPLNRYIEWAKGTVELKDRTINGRARQVVRFYRWALKSNLIEALPFGEVTVKTGRQDKFLIHIEKNPDEVKSVDVLLSEPKGKIELLTKEQVKVCLERLTNKTHRLMFEVLTRTGLRQEELRTLPEKYIFNPTSRRDLIPDTMIMVKLDPSDMKLKRNKARTIEIPYSLMEDLWWWSVRQRPVRAANSTEKPATVLFLTEAGCQYGDSALASIFNRLAAKVGFPVRPHMCRHTYATYRLWSLKNSKTFKGDPLLYVRDRLGHESVLDTAIYLKYINELEGGLVSQHEDELDKLFTCTSQ